MTDAEFAAWLRDPLALRVGLVEAYVSVNGVEQVRYLSSRPFTTGPAETPANTTYIPRMTEGLNFNEKISLTADAGLSSGDIGLANSDGMLDEWLELNYVWKNRAIKAWIGDAKWPRAQFRLVFDGIISDLGSAERDKVNLMLADKLQRLNTPVTEELLGGTTANKGALRPVLFGEGHNITPLLVDPVTQEYQFHAGPSEPITKVRTSGKPRIVDLFLSRGSFRFTTAVGPGAVTVSAHGDNVGGYTNRIAPLVRRIVTRYGKESMRFTEADLDTANLDAFDAAHPQPVGLYLNERTNVLVACQQLASSVGAQLVMSRLGKLRLLQLTLPAPGTPVVITADDMKDKTLRPVLRVEVIAAAKVGFNKNYTVQPDLQTSLPLELKSLFSTEWLSETRKDTATLAAYKLDTEPVQVDTCLLRRTDAAPEADRRLALNGVPRTVYEFDGEPAMLMLELGTPVTVFNPRFGMQGGVHGVVVSLSPNWLTGRCTVGFMV